MRRLTAEWVQKAETDVLSARKLAASAEPLHEAVCFHGQQATEKYLKAVPQEDGVPVPRTHDITDLVALLKKSHKELRRFRRRTLDMMTSFAVDTRYPGKRCNKRQAHAARR